MFVKDADGDFVNLDTGLIITNRSTSVDVVMPGEYEAISSLYIGDNGDDYMTELEKELKAYGKLILVEVQPETKCTCGNDGKPVWEHAENCPVYAPF